FKNVKTIQNGNLGQFINAPTNSVPNKLTSLNDSYKNIVVTLKSGLYKMSSKNLNSGNISVSNNTTISMNNLLSSPKNYFDWSGTRILGLSDAGISAINEGNIALIFPNICDSLGAGAFSTSNSYNYNGSKNSLANSKITYVDLSLTNITSTYINITGASDRGVFASCDSLSKIIFPKNLQSFGLGMLRGSNNLDYVTIPETVTQFEDYGYQFAYASKRITGIKILAKASKIPDYFCQNSNTLQWVQITSSVNYIHQWAFSGTNNLKIYVPDSTTQNRIKNMNLIGISSSNILIGYPPV
ncbi:MAG: leucine-rich repeat domain-containing protein, partial [Ureaplasma sp.]|nr:leucine-rich repeat domain-containing protein [Ureaplasma sp.]